MFSSIEVTSLDVLSFYLNVTKNEEINLEIIASFSTAVIVLGLFGNILSAFVFHRMSKTLKGGRLLKYLTIVDAVYLVLLFLSFHIRFLRNEYCELTYYLLNPFAFLIAKVVYNVEIYLTVLIAVHRCIAVAAPLKFIQYSHKSVTNKAIVFIFLFSVLLAVPHLMAYRPVIYWDTRYKMYLFTIKDLNVSLSEFYQFYQGQLILFFRSIVPSVTIVISNIVLVVFRRRAGIRTMFGRILVKDTGDKMTITVLVVTTISVVTHLFTGLDHVIEFRLMYIYIDTLEANMTAINSSINFIVYFILGENFRRTFVAMSSLRCNSVVTPKNAANICAMQNSRGRLVNQTSVTSLSYDIRPAS